MSVSWIQNLENASHFPEFMLGATLVSESRTQELKESMIPFGAYESKSEARQREEVLGALHQVVRQWTREQTLKKGLPAFVAHSVGGHICPFGSYRMRVHHRFDEIDALCVAPQYVDRNDFFTSFYEMLKSMPQVRDLRATHNALISAIKMDFDGVRINLLFARLDLPRVQVSLNLRDDTLVKNMDPQCVRSLNCLRATEEILRVVPNPNNFKRTLLAIMLWAKRRGIYSNTLGFLDSVSLAMLVAYTCLLYPDALASTLIHRCFCVLSQWKWPELTRQQHSKSVTDFPFWDEAVNVPAFFHKMRIVTPIFPEHTTTFNMAHSTRTIVLREIRIGLSATVDIMLHKNRWEHLFEPTKFFSRYEHYLVLLAFSATPDDQPKWRELVEGKIPNLIQSLDRNHKINLAHLNPVCYNSVPLNTNDGQPQALPTGAPMPTDASSEVQKEEDGAVVANYCSMWFIGLVFERTRRSEVIDLSFETKIFKKAVDCEAENANIQPDGILLDTDQVERDMLYQYLSSSLLLDEASSSGIKCQPPLQPTKRPAESSDTTPTSTKKQKY